MVRFERGFKDSKKNEKKEVVAYEKLQETAAMKEIPSEENVVKIYKQVFLAYILICFSKEI